MIVLPAIDLLDGHVVRLRQGDYEAVTVYHENPVEQAATFFDAGAQWVHIVDLNGARAGEMSNLHLVKEIVERTGMLVEFGGGVRSLEAIERVMEAGAARCVLGTKLVTDPEFVRQACAEYGQFIVAGVDARDGMVAIEGWREGTSTPVEELVSELRDLGVGRLVFTDIHRDGMQVGIDAEQYREVSRLAGFPVIASGGVSSLDDIKALAALGGDVVEGVIIGKALYEKAFELDEAIAIAAGVDVEALRRMRLDLASGALEEPDFLEVEE